MIGIFRSLEIDSMEFSSAALREGVLYKMSEGLVHHDIRSRTAQSLATRYDVDTEQATRVHAIALKLFESCAIDCQLDNPKLKSMLDWAALLHELDSKSIREGYNDTVPISCKTSTCRGLTKKKQLLLATLVRFQRKKIRELDIPEFDQFSTQAIHRLLVIIRIAVLLNIKRQADILPIFTVSVIDNGITLQFADDWMANKPIFEADLAQECIYLKTLNIEFAYSLSHDS